MPTKKYALIVEDDPDWIDIFEEILAPIFLIEKAKTLGEANKLIPILNKRGRLGFAIVDIHLAKNKPNSDGILVLENLGTSGVPSVAVSSYADEKQVRDAFVLGGIEDFWFKNELDTPKLGRIVKEVLEKAKSKVSEVKILSAVPRYFISLILIPLIIYSALVIATQLVPSNLASLIIGSGVILTFLLVISLALFLNKITGQQFTELIKKINLK